MVYMGTMDIEINTRGMGNAMLHSNNRQMAVAPGVFSSHWWLVALSHFIILHMVWFSYNFIG